MMHPDQLFTVRQLQHQDLLAEAEHARVRRALAGGQTAWSQSWLALWLQRVGVRRARGAASAAMPESAKAV